MPSPCQVRDTLGQSRVSQGVGVGVMKQSGGPATRRNHSLTIMMAMASNHRTYNGCDGHDVLIAATVIVGALPLDLSMPCPVLPGHDPCRYITKPRPEPIRENDGGGKKVNRVVPFLFSGFWPAARVLCRLDF